MNTLLNGQTFVDSSMVGCWSHLTFLLIVVEQSVRHFGDGEERRHLPGGGGVAGGGEGVQRATGADGEEARMHLEFESDPLNLFIGAY